MPNETDTGPTCSLEEAITKEAVCRGWTLRSQANVYQNDLDCAFSTKVKLPNTQAYHNQFMLGGIDSGHTYQQNRLYAGPVLSITDCGVVLWEHRLGRRRKHFDLQEAVRKGLDAFELASQEFDSIIHDLRHYPLGKEQSDVLLLQASRDKFMPWSRIGLVDKLYTDKEPTAWNLLTCFSEVVKQNPPFKQMGQLYGFYSLLRDIMETTTNAKSTSNGRTTKVRRRKLPPSTAATV